MQMREVLNLQKKMNICKNKDQKNIKEIYDYIRIKIIRKLYYMTHKTKNKNQKKIFIRKKIIYSIYEETSKLYYRTH